MDRFEKMEKIKQFLSDSRKLSAIQTSDALGEIGLYISPDMVNKYRRKFNLKYIKPKDLTQAIVEDYKNGKRFKSGAEMARYYKCSPSHAKKIVRDLKLKESSKRKTYERKHEKSELPPVRVNTFAHIVQQLCA